MQWIRSLGWEDPLEKEMATHSGILAWRILWVEEPGGLQSTGSQSRTRAQQTVCLRSVCFTYILIGSSIFKPGGHYFVEDAPKCQFLEEFFFFFAQPIFRIRILFHF